MSSLELHFLSLQGEEPARVHVSFFENEQLTIPVEPSGIAFEKNGLPADAQTARILSHGDVLSIVGPLRGIWVKTEMESTQGTIFCASQDDNEPVESNTLINCLGETTEHWYYRSPAMTEIAGSIRNHGKSIENDEYEIVLESMGDENIALPQAIRSRAGGKTFDFSLPVSFRQTGEYTLILRQVAKQENLRQLSDQGSYEIHIKLEKGTDGFISVSRKIKRKENGESSDHTGEMTFHNYLLQSLTISNQVTGKKNPAAIPYTIAFDGNLTSCAYTIGNQTGMLTSGERIALHNETMVLWLPVECSYTITPEAVPGYRPQQDETPVTGEMTAQGNTARFEWKYDPSLILSGTTEIPISVEFAGAAWTDETFSARVEIEDAETLAAKNTGYQFAGTDDALTFDFSTGIRDAMLKLVTDGADKGIRILREGTYRFVLTQDEGTLPSIAYDHIRYEIVVTASDDGEGHLVACMEIAGDGQDCCSFTNTCQAEMEISCRVEMEDGEPDDAIRNKHFDITGKIDNVDELNGVLSRADDTAQDIRIPLVDGQFTISLAHGERMKLAALPTDSVYTLEIETTGGFTTGQKQISGALAYGSPSVNSFVVRYGQSGTLVIDGICTLLYREPKESESVTLCLSPADETTRNEFGADFKLETVATYGAGARLLTTRATRSTAVQRSGSFRFEPLVFRHCGTYSFMLSQVRGSEPNTEYDEQVFTILVNVSDLNPLSGNLEVAMQMKKGTEPVEAIRFTNAYVASGQLVMDGVIELSGKEMESGKFQVALLSEDGTEIARTSCNSDGAFTFPAIEFHADSIGETRKYRIRMLPSSDEGIHCDEQAYSVEAAIQDNGDGTLTIRRQIFLEKPTGERQAVSEIRYMNTYEAEGETEIWLKARLLGRPFMLGDTVHAHLIRKDTEDEEVTDIVLSPKDGSRVELDFGYLGFTLADVEKSPVPYEIVIDDSSFEGQYIKGKRQSFTIELKDNGNGSITAKPKGLGEIQLTSMVNLILQCRWDDRNDRSGIRPKSLSAKLLINGKESKRYELNESNDWMIMTGLMPAVDENGKKMVYAFEPLPSRPYGLSISEDPIDGYVILARYRPHIEDEEDAIHAIEHSLTPSTGDHEMVLSWLFLFIVSLGAMVSLHRNKKQ